MEIGGVNSLYTDYLTNQASDKSASVTNTLQNTNLENASDEELMEACKSFESYFLEQVFDTMMESTKLFSDEEDDTYASKMVDYFKDTAVQELTEMATEQNGLGIAQTLFEQMKRQYSSISPEELEKVAVATDTEE